MIALPAPAMLHHPSLIDLPSDLVKCIRKYRILIFVMLVIQSAATVGFLFSSAPQVTFYLAIVSFVGFMTVRKAMPLRYVIFCVLSAFVSLSLLVRLSQRFPQPEFGYSRSQAVLDLAQSISDTLDRMHQITLYPRDASIASSGEAAASAAATNFPALLPRGPLVVAVQPTAGGDVHHALEAPSSHATHLLLRQRDLDEFARLRPREWQWKLEKYLVIGTIVAAGVNAWMSWICYKVLEKKRDERFAAFTGLQQIVASDGGQAESTGLLNERGLPMPPPTPYGSAADGSNDDATLPATRCLRCTNVVHGVTTGMTQAEVISRCERCSRGGGVPPFNRAPPTNLYRPFTGEASTLSAAVQAQPDDR